MLPSFLPLLHKPDCSRMMTVVAEKLLSSLMLRLQSALQVVHEALKWGLSACTGLAVILVLGMQSRQPDEWQDPEWARNPWTWRGQLYRLSRCDVMSGRGYFRIISLASSVPYVSGCSQHALRSLHCSVKCHSVVALFPISCGLPFSWQLGGSLRHEVVLI